MSFLLHLIAVTLSLAYRLCEPELSVGRLQRIK
jgi:hypothetical protein